MANIELLMTTLDGLSQTFNILANQVDDVMLDVKKIQGKLDNQVEAKMSIDNRFNRIQNLLKEERTYFQNVAKIGDALCSEFEQIDTQQANVFKGTEQAPSSKSNIKDVITKNYVSKYGSMAGFLLAGGSAMSISELSKWNTKMTAMNKNMAATTASVKKETQTTTKQTQSTKKPTTTTSGNYQDYRKKINALNKDKSIPVQKQLYRVKSNGKGGYTKTSGICNISSVETLLNRRLALDGKDEWFTTEDVLTSNGCKVSKSAVTWSNSKKGSESGFVYSGGTDNWSTKKYSNGEGTSYQMVRESLDTVKKNMKKEGITDYTKYIASVLDEHPEGICIRNIGAKHVAVITDYEIVNGKIQLYVADPVQVRSGSNRVKLEDSYIYKNSPDKNIFKNMENIAYLK